MKAALITEEQIKAIEDALEMVLVSSECDTYIKALDIVKSLKIQEPAAWGYIREDHLILDVICPFEHESWEGEYTIPLYSGEKP